MCYTDGSTADGEGVETMTEPLARISGPLLADAELLYDFLSECPPLPERADIILAAGSHDCRAADHAAALYLRGLAPLIVCTGGFGKMTEGMFTRPEAEVFAERCTAAGVPAGAIITECRASNTGENLPRASPIWPGAYGPQGPDSGRRSGGLRPFRRCPSRNM